MTGLKILGIVTDVGGLAVLLSLALAILVWLLRLPSQRAASWWVMAALLCIGGTVVLKIYFSACPPVPNLHNPSGHTSLSALVYGVLAMLVAVETQGWQRAMAIAGGIAFVLLIAVSRVMLGAHTPLETGFGLAIGAGALAVFARGYLSDRPLAAPLRPLMLTAAVLIVFMHGRQLHAEGLLHTIGVYLQIGAIACP